MPYHAPIYFKISSLLRKKNDISCFTLGGPWLRDAGFYVGAWVALEVGEGRLALEVVDIEGERTYRKALGMSDEEFEALLTEN